MKKKRYLIVLLSGLLITGTMAGQSVLLVKAEPLDDNISTNQTQITISSVEEWNKLATDCMVDSFSQDKTIVLTKDLVFHDDFEPIPYMSGSFDGNGHTISGISWSKMASDTAVVRYVSETGTVKNLIVEVDMTAKGTATNIGGIVSHNSGLVQNLTCKGRILADTSVGGIVSYNEESGVITQCTNKASVFGQKYVGGICGSNYGFIYQCENEGSINNHSDKGSFEATGGITGFNHGMITECNNHGTIGYQHIGYNIGGVAGLQDGKMDSCMNYGFVYARKDGGGIVGQFTPYTTVAFEELFATTISNSMNNISGLSNQLATEMSNFESITMDAAADVAGDLAGSTFNTVTSTEDLTDFKNNINSISNEMDERRENRSDYSTEAQKSMDRIVSLTSQINREMNVINASVDALSAKTDEDVIVDISSSASAEDKYGYIYQCTNYGSVYADSNVGGIVGTMDFDNTKNPEEDVKTIGDLSLNLHATIQCVIDQCTNMGNVYAVNDFSAGIVGYAERGYIKNCENQADIESENGGYVAGIAAKTKAPVEGCNVHCTLSGEKFVGGVAAEAYEIANCAAIVDILNCEEKKGAIACVVSDSFSNNYFVSDSLGGVDDITYVGRAEALTYKDMRTLLELNSDFYNFNVLFVADGKLVDSITVPFGGSIVDSQIPPVPKKDADTYGGWELFQREDIENGFVVHAIYDQWTTTIATDEQVPVMLLEGRFYPETVLNCVELEKGDYSADKWDVEGHYQVTYQSSEIPQQDGNTVHLLWNDENVGHKKMEIAVLHSDGTTEKVIPQMDGKYLVFALNDSKEFYVLSQSNHSKNIVVLIVCFLIFVLIILPVTVGVTTKIKVEKESKKTSQKCTKQRKS